MCLTNSKIIFAVLFFFTSLKLAYSQSITIRNKVTHETIIAVAAFNNTKTKSSISDLEGRIDISIFTDNETINFSHLSYTSISFLKSNLPEILYLQQNHDQLSQIILSVSKSKEKKGRVAEQIAILTQKKIQRLAPQTTADLLASTPGLRVQKSQGGGGSPVIRGFEANRVLLVIDNVRMNNAIYRSGHLQNAITVSPYNLERTEVVFGPSSVIYGSDALGGVVHFYTKTPKINYKKQFTGNTNTRYSSANGEFSQGFGGQYSAKKWASYSAISFADFNDLRMGKNRTHGYENWGLVPFYSDNNEVVYNNTPVQNKKTHIQKNTGYKQIDVLQKFNFKIKEKNNLILNFQLSESSNINRFDKLTQLKNGNLKFAEWYYGPQKRKFFSAQYQFNPKYKWLKEGTITAAYQDIQESRIKRKYGKLERTYQKENVGVFSVNTDFKVSLSKNRDLSYGLEFTYNNVKSNAYGKVLNVIDNQIIDFTETTIVQSRYPDGGSNYTTAAAYANYRQDINGKMTLNTGGRFTYTKLNAHFIDQTYISLPQTDLQVNNSSFTANLGLTYNPTKMTKWSTVFSSGFRSPNIDDIGKIREKSGLLTVPNVNLKPEFAYNGEIGLTKFIKNKRNQITINGFYTVLKNYISRAEYIVKNDITTTNENTVMYDNEEVTTIANVNGDNAAIFGGTIDVTVNPISNLFIKGNATYTKSKTSTHESLPSISPFFTTIALQYKKGKFDAEINYKYTSKKDSKNYSPNGEDNLEQSPLDDFGNYIGTPAWSTINTSLQFKYSKTLTLQVGLTNIFDIHYKEFASGISASGRNLSTTMLLNF